MPEVFKFGGASVKDAAAIRRLSELLARDDLRPQAVVVSAMGATTNALEALLLAARDEDDDAYHHRLAALRQAHLEAAEALFGPDSPTAAALLALFDELDQAHRRHRHTPYAFHYDQTVGFGELLSTTLVAAWLNHVGVATRWVDARALIVTDARHQAADIDWPATQARLAALERRDGELLLTQGFIGATVNGATTTLGREGSDFSAAVLAHCLDASGLTIWKDVPGVFDADPRYFANARQIPYLSYAEAVEQTWHGATVIHPRTLAPLQRKGIPLTVRSFLTPEAPPSRIGPASEAGDARPAVILRQAQVLLDVRPRDFRFLDDGDATDILGRLVSCGLRSHFLDLEAMRLRLAVDPKPEKLAPLLAALAESYAVERREGVTLLTVRHPSDALLATLSEGKTILAEKRSATTAQRLFPAEQCPERWQLPG